VGAIVAPSVASGSAAAKRTPLGVFAVADPRERIRDLRTMRGRRRSVAPRFQIVIGRPAGWKPHAR
jgi:hypothetical protein